MNIGEIARRAGVSRSTVSYVLSGKRPVSDEKRRRIEAVIEELDYRPNAAARALKEGRTRTIGLVIPPAGQRLTELQLAFVATVVEAAAREDLDVLLSPSGGDHDRSFERIVSGRRVDGVLLMEIRLEDERVDRLRHTSLPFVTIGRTAHQQGWWIDVDYSALIARCVHHLADLGHTNIALINRPTELVAAGYGPGHRALEGFNSAVADRGIHGVNICCADDVAAGAECIEQLIRAHPQVTAIATVNETALPGMTRGLEEAGLIVPRDFSITGVIARSLSEAANPPLTAADFPTHDLGEAAIKFLLEQIADPQATPKHHLFAPPISLRSSTGPAPRH